MSKLKIEHGASKVHLVLLKTSIEDSISTDIDLMAAWSDNERKYVINELLRFALTQDEDFLKHKAGLATSTSRPVTSAKPTPSPARSVSDASLKSDSATSTHV